MDKQDRLLTTWGEIATYLEVSARTAQKWAGTRGLPVQRYGGRVSARTRELDEWVAAETMKTRPAGDGLRRHSPAMVAEVEKEQGGLASSSDGNASEPADQARRQSLKLLVGAGVALGAAAVGAAVWTRRREILDLGTPVYGFCFDGAHIWATEQKRDLIRKIRASDRKTIGEYRVSPGGEAFPTHCLFDGKDIWIANRKSATIGRVRAADGKLAASISLPSAPYAIAFDGRCLWAALMHSKILIKIDSTSNRVEGLVELGEEDACDLAFDGSRLWVALSNDAALLKVDPGTNRVERRIILGTWRASYLYFDGNHMWASSQEANRVFKLRVPDGWPLAYRTVESASRFTHAGRYLWVSQPFADSVTRIRRSDAGVVRTHKMSGLPLALAATQDEVWVACENAATKAVVEIV
jgi:hypothetical protein